MAAAQLCNFLAACHVLAFGDQRFAGVGVDRNVVGRMANDDQLAEGMNAWPGVDHAAVSHGDY